MFKVRAFQNFYSPASTRFQAWRRWPHKETTAASSPRSHCSHWRFRIPTTKRGAGDSFARFWVWVGKCMPRASNSKFLVVCIWQAALHLRHLERGAQIINRVFLSQSSGKWATHVQPGECRLIKWSGTGSRRTRVVHLWVSLCKWKVTLGFTKVALTHLKLEGKTKTHDNKRIETSKRVCDMWISASQIIFGEGSKHYRQQCKFSKWFKNSLRQVKGQHHQNLCKPYHVGSLWCNCLKWGWSANHTHQENTSNTGCVQARRCASSQTPGPGLEQRVIGCDLPLGKRLPFGNSDFQWFQNRKKERNNRCCKMAIGLSVALARTISIVTFKPGSEQDQNPIWLLFSHPWLFFENIHPLGQIGKAWVELMPQKNPSNV